MKYCQFNAYVYQYFILQGTTEQVRGKFPQLISALETNGAKALEEFFDFVKVTGHRSESRNNFAFSIAPRCRTDRACYMCNVNLSIHGITQNVILVLFALMEFFCVLVKFPLQKYSKYPCLEYINRKCVFFLGHICIGGYLLF